MIRATVGSVLILVGCVSLALAISDCGPCKNATERIVAETREWEGVGVGFVSGDPRLGTSFDLVAADKTSYAGESLIVRDGIIESRDATNTRSVVVRSVNGSQIRMRLSDDVSALPDDCVGRPVVATGSIAEASGEFIANGLRLGPRP